MSARAMAWAWEQECPSANAKLVLLALADRADEDGECWPSRQWLHTKTGLHVESVKRALAALHKNDLLDREQHHAKTGSWSSNRYTLNLHRGSPVTHATPDVTVSPWVTSDPQVLSTKNTKKNPEALTDVSTSGAANKPGRAKDEIWDALIDLFGDVETRSERGRRNAAAKQLRDVGAVPDDIRARARRWQYTVPLTPTALVAHWSALAGRPAAKPGLSCRVCGVTCTGPQGLRDHLALVHDIEEAA